MSAAYAFQAMPVETATFRFYEELNDFLAPERRRHEFSHVLAQRATVKHMIEAFGVPHTEVELVLVNGESVGFERVLRDGDRVAVYPVFEAFDVTPLVRVRPAPLREPRFIADAHLGGLARVLRMAGFDTLYADALPDDEIARLAQAQHRIVLTRDRDLLKRRDITHGCYVHAQDNAGQAHEVFERLDLRGAARPFTRCLSCNAPLRAVDKAQVESRLPPRVRAQHERFALCEGCGRLYWEGLHWKRMRATVDALVGSRPREEARGGPRVVQSTPSAPGAAMSNRILPITDELYRYALDHSLREHPAQAALREATRSHPYAGMQIAPEQGALMAMLVKLIGARRTIEIGVFTGYSALAVALALPADGRVLACDISDDYTRIGKPFWAQAGVADRIDLQLAPALATLDARLSAGEAGRYDFAFIDADKTSYEAYYERCLQLLRPGGLIVIDNTLWGGDVARPSESADTRALQALNDKLHHDERIDLCLLPFSDGVTLARKR
jgi:predicted O-methyltransferase YrrM/uncharacterized protein with PIN domain